MKGQSFRQLYESMGPKGTYHKIVECLREGELTPADFSLKELFLGCCGESAYVELGRRYGATGGAGATEPKIAKIDEAEYDRLENATAWTGDTERILQEAGEAVDVSAFAAIVGQLAFNAIGKGWEQPEFVGDRIFRNYPTPFSGEKIPWLSNIFGATPGDSDIHPLQRYPEVTFGPRWIQTPRAMKKGGILSLSMEFVLFDRTAQAMQGFEKLGRAIRFDKEYAQIRVFMGYNPTGPLTSTATAPFAYNLNGTSYGTYLTSGSNYVNSQSGTPLVDYTSINQAIYLRSKILDPDSGRPINLGPPKDLFVMPFQVMHAKRILTATGATTYYPSPGTASVPAPGVVKFESGNPINWNINLLTSPIAYQLLLQAGANPAGVAGALSSTQINAYWWAGDFQEAFWYAEIFPFRTEQAMPNNIRQFEQDVQMRWKLSEMGVPFSYDPRNVEFFYNT